jgi:nucleoside-diphosphate-sugar epimerase
MDIYKEHGYIMKRILITGVTGYIGSFLVKELQKNNTVLGLARTPLNKTYLDNWGDGLELAYYDGTYESVLETLQTFKPDIIYHLAGYYTGKNEKPSLSALYQSNIVFGGQLLEAMAQSGCTHLIYTSSISIMRHFNGVNYVPVNLYGATKLAFSDIIRYYTETNQIRSVTLAISNTYGPKDQHGTILNVVKKAVLENKTVSFSDGLQDFDAIFIDDVVQGLIKSMDLFDNTETNQTYQISSGDIRSLRETVELFLKVNEINLKAEWGQSHPNQEIQKAIRLFPIVPGWSPKVSLEEGLKRFWTM